MCFEKSPPQDYFTQDRSGVDKEHLKFQYLLINYIIYERFVREHIFEGRGRNGFVTYALWSMDQSISDLHGLALLDTADGTEDPVFLYENHKPRTRDDVNKLLFRDGSPGMMAVKQQQYGVAIAQILKYASSVTRKGSCPERFVEGIHKWRSAWDYKFELGDTAVSARRLEIHGLVAIARRISCNSYWTGIRNQMAMKWGVQLVRGRDKRAPKDGEFVVDVKKLLPVRLRKVF